MTGVERSPTGEVVTFHIWLDATLEQIQKVRKGLKAHSQFQRLKKLEGSLTSLPRTVEIYRDDNKNMIGILHKNHRLDKNHIISSPSSAPIVDDILGRDGAFTWTF